MATTTKTNNKARVIAIEEVSNGGEEMLTPPYRVEVEVEGTAPLLFHRWNVEGVAEKAAAAKGSKAKKSDDVESYVYRNTKGNIALPGEYLRMSCIWAAKFRQDPRSPRKSAMDLYKAGLVCETELAEIRLGNLTLRDWSYLDQRRVVVQRNGITRQRPAVEKGWRCVFHLTVLTPQYIGQQDLHACLVQAGQLVGVGDFRPSYGRFSIVRYELL